MKCVVFAALVIFQVWSCASEPGRCGPEGLDPELLHWNQPTPMPYEHHYFPFRDDPVEWKHDYFLYPVMWEDPRYGYPVTTSSVGVTP